MSMKQLVEWELTGETEVLRENRPQCHFVQHESLLYLGTALYHMHGPHRCCKIVAATFRKLKYSFRNTDCTCVVTQILLTFQASDANVTLTLKISSYLLSWCAQLKNTIWFLHFLFTKLKFWVDISLILPFSLSISTVLLILCFTVNVIQLHRY
jgi:hypothetical protein